MNRNNTNFPAELYEFLTKALETSKEKDKLLYYQRLVVIWATASEYGLFLWHGMGLGKTIMSIACAVSLHKLGYKIIVLTPKSLQANYKSEIIKYNSLMNDVEGFEPISEDMFNFVIKSNVINRNVARIVGPQQVFETDRTPVKINKITTKTVFIVDESHQISQLISNGSEEWRHWYETIMVSPLAKVIMLSGSLFSSSPFELVPIVNLLSKQEIFPENYDQFMDTFWDNKARKLINRGVFQNRLFGLFSHMSLTYLEKETVNYYPTQEPTQVVRCKMYKYQLESYMLVRDKEIQEKKVNGEARSRPVVKKFETQSKDSSSYRVRSRQFSNFAPPPEIWEIYNREYTNEELEEFLAKIPIEYFHTAKFDEVMKISKHHNSTKGLIYSQFVGIGGGGALAELYRRSGYVEFKTKSNITDKSKPRFAILNGSVPAEDQAKILEIYNSAENDDGSIIHFLVVGLQQTTGLNLICACWVIMLEPYWADYIKEQLIARVRRFKSHMRFPIEKRIVHPYVMLSVYPDQMDEKILNNRNTKLTTDEHLFRAMQFDAEKSQEFKEPIKEVAIECMFVKEKNPDHICRMCAPNGKQLFTNDVNAYQSIMYDCKRGDPCDLSAKEEVKATKVKYDDVEYYAVADDNKYGYLIFFKVGNEYEELQPTSPMFKLILEVLQEPRVDKNTK